VLPAANLIGALRARSREGGSNGASNRRLDQDLRAPGDPEWGVRELTTRHGPPRHAPRFRARRAHRDAGQQSERRVQEGMIMPAR